MDIPFLARKSENERLRRFYEDGTQTAALVYGRRRVGKSALLKHFLTKREVDGLYYECRQTSEKDNADSFGELIAERYGFPRLAFSGMEEALAFLYRQAENKRMLLVLDEYPYLRSGKEGMDSILQVLIDEYRESSGLKIVLCGSYIDTMRSLLEESNPLYGRMDLVIDLKPMDYYDAASFYPTFSEEDKVRFYSVFGGIPYYNRLIDGKKSFRENVMELLVQPGARLETEVAVALRGEIAKLANANEAFGAMAKGYSRFSDILNQSHISSSSALADVLERLTKMELVRREEPINGEGNRKRAGYHICDPLALFYYRYLFRYASQRGVMDENDFYDRYIDHDFESAFVPRQFEEICRQYLIRENRADRCAEPFEKIGKYYYDNPRTKTNGEFDVVTYGSRGYVFYEAKFRKSPVTNEMMEEEIRQVNGTGLYCYRYGFFSRAGFAENIPGDRQMLYSLEDLYRSSGNGGGAADL